MEIVRKYIHYEDYLNHQKEKSLNTKRIKQWLSDWEPRVQMFYDHFNRVKDALKGKALCVCARTGQEVEALQRHGMDAIGIDIVAYPPLVIEGDAHSIPFEDNTFDFVFSNSLDHSITPDIFIGEIKRVLKPDGIGMLHLQITEDVDTYAENIITNPWEVAKKLGYVGIFKLKNDIYNCEIIFQK